jgi:hypothetical protein
MSEAAPNNGMHPTADTPALIKINRSGRRVMPGVRCSRGRQPFLHWRGKVKFVDTRRIGVQNQSPQAPRRRLF